MWYFRLPAHNYRLGPPGNKSWDVLKHDWLPEYSAIQDIPDGPIWTPPHLGGGYEQQ